MPLPVLKLMILPILQPEFVHAVRKSKLRIELEGKFAKNWEKIFHRISGCAGFVTGDANEAEIEPREVDPDYLEESFVGIQDAWEDPDSKYFFRF
jgi:hypothetical protein